MVIICFLYLEGESTSNYFFLLKDPQKTLECLAKVLLTG